MMTGRIVTVFGGTGFLGHAVVQLLAEQGYTLRIPTRDPDKALDLKLMGAVGQIQILKINPRSETALLEVIKGADIVINLIGELTGTHKNSFQHAHVETPARLARLAKAEKVQRFVHVSALGANVASDSRYARTKAIGEEAVRTFFPDAMILRPALMFGPRDRFFNRFALMARFLPFLPLIGGGHTKFQPLYVGDAALFLVSALPRLDTRGRTFLLGGSEIFTFRELMELILKTTGHHALLVSVPWALAHMKAVILEKFPDPPLTRDQIKLLKVDQILTKPQKGMGTLASLGIVPTKLAAILPTYINK